MLNLYAQNALLRMLRDSNPTICSKALLGDTIDKLQRMPEWWFDLRAIATITHSLGKLKISDERFFNEIVKLRKRIAKHSALSKIVWALATVGCELEELSGRWRLSAGESPEVATCRI